MLPKRLAKYGLTLHLEKTSLIDFGRRDWIFQHRLTITVMPVPGSQPSTCWVSPGYSAIFCREYWVVKKNTATDRFRRAPKRITDW